MTNKKQVKCLFGHHKYTISHYDDKFKVNVLVCEYCKKSAKCVCNSCKINPERPITFDYNRSY